MLAPKQLVDLDMRLEEVVMWCRRYADFNAVATCLRPGRIAPKPLPVSRWDAVESAIKARRAELGRTTDVTLDDISGRLLVYFPDARLGDGSSDTASKDFFDVHYAPPCGTWFGYFEDDGGDPHSGTTTYLLAWVPRLFVNHAQQGIDFSRGGRLAWLKDTKIAMRHVVQHLRLSMLTMD